MHCVSQLGHVIATCGGFGGGCSAALCSWGRQRSAARRAALLAGPCSHPCTRLPLPHLLLLGCRPHHAAQHLLPLEGAPVRPGGGDGDRGAGAVLPVRGEPVYCLYCVPYCLHVWPAPAGGRAAGGIFRMGAGAAGPHWLAGQAARPEGERLASIHPPAACFPACCLPSACWLLDPCPMLRACRRTSVRRSGGYRRWAWRPAALTAARRCRCPGGVCATPSSGGRLGWLAGC